MAALKVKHNTNADAEIPIDALLRMQARALAYPMCRDREFAKKYESLVSDCVNKVSEKWPNILGREIPEKDLFAFLANELDVKGIEGSYVGRTLGRKEKYVKYTCVDHRPDGYDTAMLFADACTRIWNADVRVRVNVNAPVPTCAVLGKEYAFMPSTELWPRTNGLETWKIKPVFSFKGEDFRARDGLLVCEALKETAPSADAAPCGAPLRVAQEMLLWYPDSAAVKTVMANALRRNKRYSEAKQLIEDSDFSERNGAALSCELIIESAESEVELAKVANYSAKEFVRVSRELSEKCRENHERRQKRWDAQKKA